MSYNKLFANVIYEIQQPIYIYFVAIGTPDCHRTSRYLYTTKTKTGI